MDTRDTFARIFNGFKHLFDIDGKGDKQPLANVSLTVGVVVDTDDPLQEGRLRIFCGSLNDNPEKLQHLPWAAYVSPVGGVIDNGCFTRGSDPANATSSGPMHYGFHAIPEQGAHALVGCIDGDPRRRFWLGCFPSHQETHTLFNGRFKWNSANGQPDGPLTSTDQPIQPTYDNLSEAFQNQRTSREWKTRGADYQAMAVNQDVQQLPNTNDTTYLDEQASQIAAAEEDSWVKKILGAHGYDWTSFKGLGSFLASKVFGWSTPGFHAITMDDRAFNSRVRVRTTAGSQILMDDTNERIYISTAKGGNYIEMDFSGNIDVYAKRRLSYHAEEDINFSAGGSIRMKAKEGISLYAGDTTGQSPLPAIPPDGQIRLHASNDMHVYTQGNFRQHTMGNNYIEVDKNINIIAQTVNETIDAFNLKVSGDVVIKAEGSITEVVSQNGLMIGSSSVTLSAMGTTTIADSTNNFTPQQLGIILAAKQSGSGSTIPTGPSPVSGSPSEAAESDTEIAIWTNRVPQHEPWPRVMKQDSNDPINAMNNGYKNNVDWIDQYDNITSPAGLQPIGRVEGDETIVRGEFWRR